VKISKKEADEKKKKWRKKYAKKRKNMGTLATILVRKRTVKNAVDFHKLVELSRLTEEQVKKAIEDMKDAGMNIALTDDQPPRFYWPSKITI
jgi:tRNA G26 N,N-dimethylase Trm1